MLLSNHSSLVQIAALWALGMQAICPADARSEKERLIKGKIDSYECGDNCYLTIIDKSQKKITGLCVARECTAWNYETKLACRHSLSGKK